MVPGADLSARRGFRAVRASRECPPPFLLARHPQTGVGFRETNTRPLVNLSDSVYVCNHGLATLTPNGWLLTSGNWDQGKLLIGSRPETGIRIRGVHLPLL